MSFSSVRHLPFFVLDGADSRLCLLCELLYSLKCLHTVIVVKVFLNYCALFLYPVFFGILHSFSYLLLICMLLLQLLCVCFFQLSSFVTHFKDLTCDPRLFLLAMFPQNFICCFCHHWVEFGGHFFSIFVKSEKSCKLSAIVAWKDSSMVGSFSLVVWGFLIFSRTLRFSSTRSWSLSISAPGNALVLALQISDLKRFCIMM